MRYHTIYHLRMKIRVNRLPFPQKCHFGAFPGVENNFLEFLEDEIYGLHLVFDVYKAPLSRILCDLPHYLVLTICSFVLFSFKNKEEFHRSTVLDYVNYSTYATYDHHPPSAINFTNNIVQHGFLYLNHRSFIV